MTLLQLAEAERAAIIRRAGGLARLKKRTPRGFTPTPRTTRALREAGMTAADAALLVEGDQHERGYVAEMDTPGRLRVPDLPDAVAHALATLQETTGDGADNTGQLTMPPMTGWTSEGDGASTYAHAQHGRLKLGAGRWTRHHATTGRILASGTTQESLGNHLRGLVGDTGNAGAADANAEALADLVARVRGVARDTVPAAARTMVEERLTPRGPDLSATHALVRERMNYREAVPVEARNLVEALRKSGRLPSGAGSGATDDVHARARAAAAR